MKDEELFKAWKSEQYKDQSTEEKLEFVEHLHNFPKYFEKTFLAGLKAGRPQWRYMKDVNCYEDLPHNEDVYYAYVVNVGAYDKPTIERRLGSFAEFEFDVMAYHVIAWCEIPIFDKE